MRLKLWPRGEREKQELNDTRPILRATAKIMKRIGELPPSNTETPGQSITQNHSEARTASERCNLGAILDPAATLCPLKRRHVDSITAALDDTFELENA